MRDTLADLGNLSMTVLHVAEPGLAPKPKPGSPPSQSRARPQAKAALAPKPKGRGFVSELADVRTNNTQEARIYSHDGPIGHGKLADGLTGLLTKTEKGNLDKTTAAPTTISPTTVSPTTISPATVSPTTVSPTTSGKGG